MHQITKVHDAEQVVVGVGYFKNDDGLPFIVCSQENL